LIGWWGLPAGSWSFFKLFNIVDFLPTIILITSLND